MKTALIPEAGRTKPQRRGHTIHNLNGAKDPLRSRGKKQMKARLLIFIFGLLFLSGIMLAGSDGAFFPWPNVLGLLLTATAGFISSRLNLSHFH